MPCFMKCCDSLLFFGNDTALLLCTEKKSRVISEKEKRITAFHEAGHAILFHLLPDVGPVHTVSIIPTGAGAAGYTMPLPEKDEMFNTRGKMIQSIMVSLGGRIAEELTFDDITTCLLYTSPSPRD